MGAGVILMSYWNGEPVILGLLGDEKTRKKYGAMFDLPKGTEDHGETSMECALRETFEETGVRLKKSQLIEGPYRTSFLTMWIAVIPIDTTITIQQNPVTGIFEHDGFEWLKREQALKLVYPYLAPFVQWAFKCI